MQEMNNQGAPSIKNRLPVLQKFKNALRLFSFPCMCVWHVYVDMHVHMCTGQMCEEGHTCTCTHVHVEALTWY